MTAFAELAFVDTSKSVSPYLTPREVSSQIETAIRTLRNVAYYCAVENKAARTSAIGHARDVLRVLANTIEDTPTSPVPGNLKKLLTFMIYSLEIVNRTNNPEAAQECIAMLEPLQLAFSGR
jgi:flagellin-specific chaperone FliS